MATGYMSPISLILQVLSDQGVVGAGYKVNTYVAGTVSTPLTTYTDNSLVTPNSNPIVLGSNGRFQSVSVWNASGTTMKVVITDASGSAIVGGTIDNIPLLNDVSATAGFARTAAEIAAGVTPTNLGYLPGDIRRYGGSGDNGTTDNTTALQQCLNANAGFTEVVIPNMGGYYKVNGTIAVPANSHVSLRDNAEIRWASTTASGPTFNGVTSRPGLNITGSNVRIEGKGILTGSAGALTFLSMETGIICVGTSAASPTTSIYIGPQREVRWWGQFGIGLQYVLDFQIDGCTIHDGGYSGAHYLSCTRGKVNGNEVYNMLGSGGNAYGLSGTAYPGTSTAGSSRADANPLCTSVEVCHNFVHDIPLWTGIDVHGGYECSVHHNNIYNCQQGINFGYLPNAASNSYAGYNNSIEFNNIYINKYNNASSTGVTPSNGGMTLAGSAAANLGGAAYGMRVVGNTIDGYGNNTGTAFAMYLSGYFDQLTIEKNVFRNWSGYGIYLGGLFSGTQLLNNEFGNCLNSYANSACIYVNNNKQTINSVAYDGDPPLIANNRCRYTPTGSGPSFGVSVFRGNCVNGINAHANDFAGISSFQFANEVAGQLLTTYLQGFSLPSGFGCNGVAAPAQVTGFGSPVGAAVIASYNITDAGGANSNTNKCVAQILTVLKANGMIGA